MNRSAQEIYAVLRHYQHIVVTAHVSPDGDAIGSVVALYHALKGLGKDVHMVLDDTIDDKFFFLPGVTDIRTPDQVTPDPSWLTVILDCTGLSRIGKAAALVQGKTLNIDHHISNEHFADWEYVVPEQAATCEILTELFSLWQIPLTQDIVNPLYMGIATDCGFFKFSNTKGHTLRMAAALVDAGAQPNVISEHLDARSMDKLKALSEVLKHIELFADNRISCISYTPEILQLTGEHTGMYIDYARNLKGVDVAFTVKYISDTETRVSLRSKAIDVNAIAGVFGGGGHIRAAGCTIEKPLGEAKELLVKEIEKAL